MPRWKTLERWKIITITDQGRKEDGSFKALVYTLLDKREWKPKPPSASPAVGTKQQEPSANDDISRRHVVPDKETHINQTHIKEIATSVAPSDKPLFPYRGV